MYNRREMIAGAGVAAGATLLLGQNARAAQGQKDTAPGQTRTPGQRRREALEEAEISIPEDLMRQHAIVNRLLLVYETAITPATETGQTPMKAVATTAEMLRSNVDNFHVRLEEEHIFPLFLKSDKMVDLVNTLKEQHAAAKRLTDTILKSTQGATASANRETLARDIRAYVRMIQAHTAYEETLLYPQIRTLAGADELNKIEKAFRDAARQRPASESFAGLVAKIADLERAVGITGLAQFTATTGRETAMGTAGTSGTATR